MKNAKEYIEKRKSECHKELKKLESNMHVSINDDIDINNMRIEKSNINGSLKELNTIQGLIQTEENEMYNYLVGRLRFFTGQMDCMLIALTENDKKDDKQRMNNLLHATMYAGAFQQVMEMMRIFVKEIPEELSEEIGKAVELDRQIEIQKGIAVFGEEEIERILNIPVEIADINKKFEWWKR